MAVLIVDALNEGPEFREKVRNLIDKTVCERFPTESYQIQPQPGRIVINLNPTVRVAVRERLATHRIKFISA